MSDLHGIENDAWMNLDLNSTRPNPMAEHQASSTSKFVQPEFVQFPADKKHIELDLSVERRFLTKDVMGGKSAVLDVSAFTPDQVILAVKSPTNGAVALKKFDLYGNLTEDKPEDVYKMTVLEEGISMAKTNGLEVIVTSRDQQGQLSDRTLDFAPTTRVQAITSMNTTTLAVALEKRVFFLSTEGGQKSNCERMCGQSCLSGVWCYPVVDMCSMKDDALLIFDACGIHQINPHDGHDELIQEHTMKDISSVAAYDDNFLIACDPKNKLYLFGLDNKMVVKVWSVQQFLIKGDTLEHISVFRKNTCVVSTKFGFVLVITISLKRVSD